MRQAPSHRQKKASSNYLGFKRGTVFLVFFSIILIVGGYFASVAYYGRQNADGGTAKSKGKIVVKVESKNPKFDLMSWEKKYLNKKQNIKEWQKNTGGVWGSWFDTANPECAEKYLTTWGPLGIRTRMLDQTWKSFPAFKARWPKYLQDKDGTLLFNCFEVASVIPGSPAEGHLKVGDYIVEMSDNRFKTAKALPVDYMGQGTRGLEMHAGLLLDQAEGKGSVSFKVIRVPKGTKLDQMKVNVWKKKISKSFMTDKSPMKLSGRVRGGEMIKLLVDDGGNGNGSDGFDWRGLKLTNGKKDIFFYDLPTPVRKTGWSKIKVNKSNGDWWVHAPSDVEFLVPEGEWEIRGQGESRGTVDAFLYIKEKNIQIPSLLNKYVKNVSFKIPALGSFTKGFPTNCPKSQNIIDTTADWLVKQQNEDGSFPRPSGYTSNHYDTAWAGLGLMSTGNKKYDEAIKKAAYFTAFAGVHDKWAVPSSMAITFMCEYWLRYRDDKILPAIQVRAERVINEMVYGDFTTGHGQVPGYKGYGVSIGGSSVTLALALVDKTPIKLDEDLVDKMLERAQELAPSGFIPYGRGSDDINFEPNLEAGGSYSGRHAPYLIASLIHGGPKLFTENATAMYAKGPLGGLDIGHASQTMTFQWGILASANISDELYKKQLEALKWKITMLRYFKGGFVQNGYRLEFQGAESLLDYALRSGSYLLALCAGKHNLAITGDQKYRAAHLKDIPPTSFVAKTLHDYYLRNWAVAEAALGKDAPLRLVRGVKTLQKMTKGKNLKKQLFDFIEYDGPRVAKEILAIKGKTLLLRNSLAEMVIGVDQRITVEPKKDSPGKFGVTIDTQHAFAGRWNASSDKKELKSWQDSKFMPMEGSLVIRNRADRKIRAKFSFKQGDKIDWGRWSLQKQSGELLAKAEGETKMLAYFDYKVGDIHFKYVRPIWVNAANSLADSEAARSIVNDRQVWVLGTLLRDQSTWNISFNLASGQYISAATPAGPVWVEDKDRKRWTAPTDRSLTMGTKALFCFTSGWQGIEARVSKLKIVEEGCKPIKIKSLDIKAKSKNGVLSDLEAGREIEIKLTDAVKPEPRRMEMICHLQGIHKIRAINMLKKSIPKWWVEQEKVTVYAKVGNEWKTIYWGKYDRLMMQVVPTLTDTIKIVVTHSSFKEFDLSLLKFYSYNK